MVANLKFFESIKIRLTNFLLWNDVNKANLNALQKNFKLAAIYEKGLYAFSAPQ